MQQPTTWRPTKSSTTNSKEVSMVASSTTSPGTTTQKLAGSRTSVRPGGLYHPAFFSKASSGDPSRNRQQHLKQPWTAETQQKWRRWQQQPHQMAHAPAHPTAHLRTSSKD